MSRLIRLLAVGGLVLAGAPALAAAQYRITRTYALGGDGSWDYVVPDAKHHRVFIGRQNRVMVVDEADGKLLGEITGIKGAHGTAIAEASGRGFATSGNDSAVVMFDLSTFKVLGRIPAARWGQPGDIGDAAVFLLAPASDYMHGAVMPVDGGWLAR